MTMEIMKTANGKSWEDIKRQYYRIDRLLTERHDRILASGMVKDPKEFYRFKELDAKKRKAVYKCAMKMLQSVWTGYSEYWGI